MTVTGKTETSLVFGEPGGGLKSELKLKFGSDTLHLDTHTEVKGGFKQSSYQANVDYFSKPTFLTPGELYAKGIFTSQIWKVAPVKAVTGTYENKNGFRLRFGVGDWYRDDLTNGLADTGVKDAGASLRSPAYGYFIERPLVRNDSGIAPGLSAFFVKTAASGKVSFRVGSVLSDGVKRDGLFGAAVDKTGKPGVKETQWFRYGGKNSDGKDNPFFDGHFNALAGGLALHFKVGSKKDIPLDLGADVFSAWRNDPAKTQKSQVTTVTAGAQIGNLSFAYDNSSLSISGKPDDSQDSWRFVASYRLALGDFTLIPFLSAAHVNVPSKAVVNHEGEIVTEINDGGTVVDTPGGEVPPSPQPDAGPARWSGSTFVVGGALRYAMSANTTAGLMANFGTQEDSRFLAALSASEVRFVLESKF